jgi:ElaA protein
MIDTIIMNWDFKYFDELNPHELYAILQLRNEVFVVEQQCVFQDADNKDQDSYHLMGWQNDKLVAYTRIVPPGIIYPQPSVGRVVTHPASRRSGIGKLLMLESLNRVVNLFGEVPVKIGAQLYLKNFYESLGFRQTGEIYLEDGIKHIEMIRVPSVS